MRYTTKNLMKLKFVCKSIFKLQTKSNNVQIKTNIRSETNKEHILSFKKERKFYVTNYYHSA